MQVLSDHKYAIFLIFIQPFRNSEYMKWLPRLMQFDNRIMYSTKDIQVLDLWLESAAADADTASRLKSWFAGGEHSLTDLTFRYVSEDPMELIPSLLVALEQAPFLIRLRILTPHSVSTEALFWPC